VIEALSTAWPGGGPDILVRVAGGGGEVALPIIRRLVPHAKLMDDAPTAVVIGMLEYAMAEDAEKGDGSAE